MTSASSRSPSHLLALACATVLLMASCSGSEQATNAPGMPDRFPNHSADQIRGQILRTTDTLHSYTAKARVTVKSPDENRTFNAVVHHRRADSLFMRVSLFGIEGGRVLLTPDSVFFYDTRKAVLRAGPLEDVQEFFPVPVSSADFFRTMLGLVAPDPSTAWSLQADSTLYYVSNSTDRRRYTVDPTRWRVVRYEERSANGTVVRKQLFSDFRSVNGVLLPSRVIFQRPANDLRAAVRYQEMTLNPSSLSFNLDVPSQVPRKPFR